MKINHNIIFFALAAGALLLSSCAQKEELNLGGIPASSAGLTIDDQDEGVYQIDLEGSYDGDGVLNVTGEMSQSYTFALSNPSLEEVRLKVEPILANIPEGKYTISATNLVIPVGERAATVSVALNLAEDNGEDLSFMADNVEPVTYELGVRLVGMDGTNVEFDGPQEAKVVLVKDAYVAGAYLMTNGNSEVNFIRSYAEREILDEEDMSFTFRVYLERPAKEDVKVTFATEGLTDAFKSHAVVTPAEVTIPAGEKMSDEITWTLSDDFLETTTENENHTLSLVPTVTSDDPTVSAVAGITVNVEKIRNVVKVLTGLDPEWTAYSRTDWSCTINGSNTSVLFDGSTYSDYGIYTGEPMIVEVDMKQAQIINGIVVNYYANSSYYGTDSVTISVSNDGQEWETVGLVNGRAGSRYLKLLDPPTARYVRYEGVSTRTIYIAEFNVYHK